MPAESTSCPKCGATIAEGAPFGLCSGCLVAAALEEDETRAVGPNLGAADGGLPFEHIGRFRLLYKLGEGAFGEVFAAEQGQPVEREVAIKILKRGMDSAQVVARFEAERQALALMSHPNVATVLDGGETEDGRPYFVMELVDGKPVTEFCNERELGLRERLHLFIEICEGVQHAHGRGIIHRDLKPHNVLVEPGDGRQPVAKVIDFGIAKATERLLTTRTLYTELGRMVGTPAYMSPEQAESAGADVDVRTDVYSLGILLYELLTGSTPFDPQRLQGASAAEMERILKEEEPPRPSVRLTAETGASGSVGSTIVTARQLSGDLDWIVMRALEKARERRYGSVSDLARDVGRFLDGDAVEARPPSTTYQLRKWARKHRVPLLASAAVFIALAAGTVVSTTQMLRAMRAERAAEERAEIAKALNDFFEDDLIAAALENGALDFPSLVQVLIHAEQKIEGRLTRYPIAEAGARLMLARTLLGAATMANTKNPFVLASIYGDARRNARRAYDLFGGELESLADRRFIGSAQTLARALLGMGKANEALAVIREVFDRLGDETDLHDKYQSELATSQLEAAQAVGELEALIEAHGRVLASRYENLDAWKAVDHSYRALSQYALDEGRVDDAAELCRRAGILAMMTSHSGTWPLYEAAHTTPLRLAIQRAGAQPEQTIKPWPDRLGEWDLESMADRFAFPEPARSMLLAYLQAENGDPSAAAATLVEFGQPLVQHVRALYLERAGELDAAASSAWKALREAPMNQLTTYSFAADWVRLRTASQTPFDPGQMPISEAIEGPGGHRYALVELPSPWHEAAAVCRHHGGHLVTISGSAENSFLYETFARERICWLGASDHENEEEWRWVTGEPWGQYENWSTNQPSGTNEELRGDDAADEDFAVLGNFDFRDEGVRTYLKTGGRWHDLFSHGVFNEARYGTPGDALLICYAICEWDE